MLILRQDKGNDRPRTTCNISEDNTIIDYEKFLDMYVYKQFQNNRLNSIQCDNTNMLHKRLRMLTIVYKRNETRLSFDVFKYSIFTSKIRQRIIRGL